MKFFKSKLFIGVGVCAMTIVAYGLTVNAQDMPSLTGLFSNTQVVFIAVPPTPTPLPTWTIAQKIIEAENLLKNIKLTVGNKDITYIESRYANANGKMITSDRKFSEPEKQIALAVMNTDSGQIQVITIIKRGAELIAPVGFDINILQRLNGIIWNGWNTAYKINAPVRSVVIANVYPNETDTKIAQKKKGKIVYLTRRTVKYQLYAPYSPDLHTSELIKSGADYTNTIVAKAFNELRAAGVKSRAASDTPVADVFASHSEFFGRIPLLEQTDLTEFEVDPQNTIERAQVIIGANQDQAFGTTCNSSSACGWLQFTPRTYANIVKNYPSAKLIKDFKIGAADHLNSMKAAILLYDENLKGLIIANGSEVLTDSKLEEYLASSYNGAPKHVYKTLAASIIGGIQDWIDALTSKKGGLKDETKGYLVKLRWLQQNSTKTLTSISQ